MRRSDREMEVTVGQWWSLSLMLMLFPLLSHSTPINRQVGISENVFITVQNDTYGNEQRVCSIDTVTYVDGDSIPTSSPCEHCICRPPGFACTIISCEYRPGCKALKRSDQCCPEYQCECEKDGKIYQNGEKILDNNNPCEVCYCQGGDVICAVIDCYWRNDCQPRYIENRCCPLYDHCAPPSDPGPTRPTRPTIPTTTSVYNSWYNLSAAIYETSSPSSSVTPQSTTTVAPVLVVSTTEASPAPVVHEETAQSPVVLDNTEQSHVVPEIIAESPVAPVKTEEVLTQAVEKIEESPVAPVKTEEALEQVPDKYEGGPVHVPADVVQQPLDNKIEETLLPESAPAPANSPAQPVQPLDLSTTNAQEEIRPSEVQSVVVLDSTSLFVGEPVPVIIVPSPVQDVSATQVPILSQVAEALAIEVQPESQPEVELNPVIQSENLLQQDEIKLKPTEALEIEKISPSTPAPVYVHSTEVAAENEIISPSAVSAESEPSKTILQSSVSFVSSSTEAAVHITSEEPVSIITEAPEEILHVEPAVDTVPPPVVVQGTIVVGESKPVEPVPEQSDSVTTEEAPVVSQDAQTTSEKIQSQFVPSNELTPPHQDQEPHSEEQEDEEVVTTISPLHQEETVAVDSPSEPVFVAIPSQELQPPGLGSVTTAEFNQDEVPAAKPLVPIPGIIQPDASIFHDSTTIPLLSDTTDAPAANDATDTPPVLSDATNTPVLNDAVNNLVVNGVANTPVLNDATDAPDLIEATDAPVLNDATDAPVLNEATDAPVLNDATDVPVLNDASDAPVLNDATDAPVLNDATDAPVLNDATDAPILFDSNAPVLNDNTNTPVLTDAADAPILNDSTDIPVINDSTDTPVLNDSTDTPVLNDSTDTPAINDSTDTPVLNDSTDTPVLNDSTDNLVINYGTDAPALHDVANDQVLSDSTNSPVLQDAPNSPVTHDAANDGPGPHNEPDSQVLYGTTDSSALNDATNDPSVQDILETQTAGPDIQQADKPQDSIKILVKIPATPVHHDEVTAETETASSQPEELNLADDTIAVTTSSPSVSGDNASVTVAVSVISDPGPEIVSSDTPTSTDGPPVFAEVEEVQVLSDDASSVSAVTPEISTEVPIVALASETKVETPHVAFTDVEPIVNDATDETSSSVPPESQNEQVTQSAVVSSMDEINSDSAINLNLDQNTFEIIPPETQNVQNLPIIQSLVKEEEKPVAGNIPVQAEELSLPAAEQQDEIVPTTTIRIDTKGPHGESNLANADDDTIEIVGLQTDSHVAQADAEILAGDLTTAEPSSIKTEDKNEQVVDNSNAKPLLSDVTVNEASHLAADNDVVEIVADSTESATVATGIVHDQPNTAAPVDHVDAHETFHEDHGDIGIMDEPQVDDHSAQEDEPDIVTTTHAPEQSNDHIREESKPIVQEPQTILEQRQSIADKPHPITDEAHPVADEPQQLADEPESEITTASNLLAHSDHPVSPSANEPAVVESESASTHTPLADDSVVTTFAPEVHLDQEDEDTHIQFDETVPTTTQPEISADAAITEESKKSEPESVAIVSDQAVTAQSDDVEVVTTVQPEVVSEPVSFAAEVPMNKVQKVAMLVANSKASAASIIHDEPAESVTAKDELLIAAPQESSESKFRLDMSIFEDSNESEKKSEEIKSIVPEKLVSVSKEQKKVVPAERFEFKLKVDHGFDANVKVKYEEKAIQTTEDPTPLETHSNDDQVVFDEGQQTPTHPPPVNSLNRNEENSLAPKIAGSPSSSKLALADEPELEEEVAQTTEPNLKLSRDDIDFSDEVVDVTTSVAAIVAKVAAAAAAAPLKLQVEGDQIRFTDNSAADTVIILGEQPSQDSAVPTTEASLIARSDLETDRPSQNDAVDINSNEDKSEIISKIESKSEEKVEGKADTTDSPSLIHNQEIEESELATTERGNQDQKLRDDISATTVDSIPSQASQEDENVVHFDDTVTATTGKSVPAERHGLTDDFVEVTTQVNSRFAAEFHDDTDVGKTTSAPAVKSNEGRSDLVTEIPSEVVADETATPADHTGPAERSEELDLVSVATNSPITVAAVENETHSEIVVDDVADELSAAETTVHSLSRADFKTENILEDEQGTTERSEDVVEQDNPKAEQLVLEEVVTTTSTSSSLDSKQNETKTEKLRQAIENIDIPRISDDMRSDIPRISDDMRSRSDISPLASELSLQMQRRLKDEVVQMEEPWLWRTYNRIRNLDFLPRLRRQPRSANEEDDTASKVKYTKTKKATQEEHKPERKKAHIPSRSFLFW